MSERPAIPPGPFLVVGLARSGQAAAKLLAARGHTVIGADAGRPPGAETLGDFGVEAHLENDGLSLLDSVATVIKSPGVPAAAPVITHARAAGRTVIGELELGWRMLPNAFIAVTGTNGKTTTTELIGAIYREAGLPVAVAGNVGTPVCELVAGLDPEATVVCESSSFQLEDCTDFNPEVAILLNVAVDHLDRHATFDDYVQAKLTMFERQRRGQFAIAGSALGFDLPGEGEKAVADVAQLPVAPEQLGIRGAHNLENAAAAAVATTLLGVPRDAIAGALRRFKGVEHRLEDVAEIGGVAYVNDSKATNVAAATVALRSFSGGVHAIIGGSLKGERFTALREPAAAVAKAVYLIGESAPRLRADLAGAGVELIDSGTLEAAVAAAGDVAEPGETVLLVPACASFDQFRDYEHRGETFKQLVTERAAAGART